jgi:hypothetical protein
VLLLVTRFSVVHKAEQARVSTYTCKTRDLELQRACAAAGAAATAHLMSSDPVWVTQPQRLRDANILREPLIAEQLHFVHCCVVAAAAYATACAVCTSSCWRCAVPTAAAVTRVLHAAFLSFTSKPLPALQKTA